MSIRSGASVDHWRAVRVRAARRADGAGAVHVVLRFSRVVVLKWSLGQPFRHRSGSGRVR